MGAQIIAFPRAGSASGKARPIAELIPVLEKVARLAATDQPEPMPPASSPDVGDEIMARSKATGRKIKVGGIFQALFLANAIERLAKEAGNTPDVVSLRDAALRTLNEIVEEGVYA